MATEARLQRLEETDSILTELTATVAGMVQRQEDLLERHEERFADHQEQLADHREMLADHREQLERHREQLAEMRHDAEMTRRLWVRLATKYGWLDDEDSEEDLT